MNEVLGAPISRRTVIGVGAATMGGLVVACRHTNKTGIGSELRADGDAVSPFGALQITPDNHIRFITTRSEAGQGIAGGFSVLLAEELDVNPESIEFVNAGINNRLATLSPQEQNATGGSTSIRIFYLSVRKSAAMAREMLIAAAAASWQVPVAECSVKDGAVVHAATNRTATYGSLVAAAAALPVPSNPQIKVPPYKYIGKANRRTDILAKVKGTAEFGIDVKVNGMLNATIVHCPFVGGTLVSVDETAARAQKGVKNVIKTPFGVIVVADTFWHASLGAKSLVIQWSQTTNASSASILANFKTLVEAPAMVAANKGNADTAIAGAVTKVETAYFQTPYLPHTTLEPQNCVAWVKPDGSCEIWAPTQDPSTASQVAAAILGISPAKVKVNVTLIGGGFGRRLRQDYVAEAIYAAQAMPNQPIKILWQRNEEFTHAMFRPGSYNKLEAGLDANNKIIGWKHRIASSSIFSWGDEQPSNLIKPAIRTTIDGSSVEGAEDTGYDLVNNFRCEWAQYEPGVPVFWWRSVGHSQNTFPVESYMDECAVKAGADPIQFRLDHTTDPRHRAVLQLVRDKSGWATPPPAGTGRGVAVHGAFGSVVAQVVEVEVQTRTIIVKKVVVAIDCGTAVDSFMIHTQMESAVAQALAGALKQEITFSNGRVNEATLNECQPLTLSEMPVVETHIVQSTAAPGGVGEPGVPPLAPAIANAVFNLTKQRLRTLPLRFPASN